MINLAECKVPGVRKVDSGDVGEILRFGQNWVMYTPSPPTDDGWWVVSGHALQPAAGGLAAPKVKAFDVLAALRGDGWAAWPGRWGAWRGALQHVPTASHTAYTLLYRSPRWEKFFENYGKSTPFIACPATPP